MLYLEWKIEVTFILFISLKLIFVAHWNFLCYRKLGSIAGSPINQSWHAEPVNFLVTYFSCFWNTGYAYWSYFRRFSHTALHHLTRVLACICIHTETHTHTFIHTHIDRHTNRHRHIDTQRDTHRQAHTETHRHKDTHRYTQTHIDKHTHTPAPPHNIWPHQWPCIHTKSVSPMTLPLHFSQCCIKYLECTFAPLSHLFKHICNHLSILDMD